MKNIFDTADDMLNALAERTLLLLAGASHYPGMINLR